ncbi:MAG TPA: hypothetical protein VN231_13975 [Allosphingosinicella sp.]|nr:hypothetical protein [Allosphingosinicella sp.]
MKALLAACTALTLAMPAAAAQHGGHGQHAPPPPPPPPPPADHSVHQPPPADHSAHQSPPADDSALPPVPVTPEPAPVDHSGHAAPAAHAEHQPMAMTGALGPYPSSREASGTAWQPDSSIHGGLHVTAGDWMLMGHLMLNGVYDWQQGPRGDERWFVSGMAMAAARRDLAGGSVLQLRAMLSPDPLMGRRGYPLHLAAGETADGVTPLVDRQHPHELFMELAASYSVRLAGEASLFLYAGLPGEPAFGPPAFMHRMSIMDSPEAPITHHWLDSTHIVFGVVTAGLVAGNVKVEASRFNGREPDHRRYDIETGPLDSTAVRLSWNPVRELSLQASWARLIEPEQLEPGENSTRWSASAIYTRRLGRTGWWSTSLAWGRRSAEHEQLDAFFVESAAGLGAWTLFARAERIETNELLAEGGHHGPTFDVAKASLGAVRDFRLGRNVRLGLGGLYAFNFVPDGLEAQYAGDPDGAMLFVRLRID